MAAGAVSSDRATPHNARWKWLLLPLCALAGVLLFAVAAHGKKIHGVVKASAFRFDVGKTEEVDGDLVVVAAGTIVLARL
ncbi:MAG: hypothetical protein JO192_06305 [Candidatus Eremiobacteraeota bacterium]|nr:hypothetical protein [Candidatus Eremiobacteraeota bacterium]